MKYVKNMTKKLLVETIELLFKATIVILGGILLFIVIIMNVLISALLAVVAQKSVQHSFKAGMDNFMAYIKRIFDSEK